MSSEMREIEKLVEDFPGIYLLEKKSKRGLITLHRAEQ